MKRQAVEIIAFFILTAIHALLIYAHQNLNFDHVRGGKAVTCIQQKRIAPQALQKLKPAERHRSEYGFPEIPSARDFLSVGTDAVSIEDRSPH